MSTVEMNLTEEDWATLAGYLGATDWQMVGSTYILGQGNDVDYLFLVEEMDHACEFLHRKGWKSDSSAEYAGTNMATGFVSFKTGRMNALVTGSPAFFRKFVNAAEVCKLLRLEKRKDRVNVHRIMLYGETADQLLNPSKELTS